MNRYEAQALSAFLFTLEWLVAVMERYASPIEFGLVHIAYGGKNELGDAYGAPEASKRLDAVTEALRRSFRRSDLVARSGPDFWIMVPYTPATERIDDKVIGIVKQANHEDLLRLVDLRISIFTLPATLGELGKKPSELSALEFLTHLKENTGAYARHTIQLPSMVE